VDKEIPIKKGWKNGTKITFEREGDELPGVIPADIVFILNTKPHPRFEREGDDLVYAATVTLEQALTGVEVSVQTLDGRVLKVVKEGRERGRGAVWCVTMCLFYSLARLPV
jgi:DnaJ-class molecular chaperone